VRIASQLAERSSNQDATLRARRIAVVTVVVVVVLLLVVVVMIHGQHSQTS
jgi:CHASE3 domain sensor protein